MGDGDGVLMLRFGVRLGISMWAVGGRGMCGGRWRGVVRKVEGLFGGGRGRGGMVLDCVRVLGWIVWREGVVVVADGECFCAWCWGRRVLDTLSRVVTAEYGYCYGVEWTLLPHFTRNPRCHEEPRYIAKTMMGKRNRLCNHLF